MKIVCLDTHILIWGIKKQYSVGQEDKVELAGRFLDFLEEEKILVYIPVPIISELLAPVDPSDYNAFLEVIHKRFRVIPVDEIAAIECAKIWHSKKDDEELKKYREENGITRERMKFDFQIAAVAITRNCECIYSEDPHIKKFVGDLIDVNNIPEIPDKVEENPNSQVTLFGDSPLYPETAPYESEEE
ncbi:type II toxin-antitoxin system VapC family toxin [Flagellimonas lutaonensis]|uniref:PIN domain-containing protein n=1 Tax=Flagellimonas lutaonensis TaxID=516051 RepID=A0A0D5YUR6_9FLAO|nr:PIN domain-containing protein [Allomuricauda lutaonensis]AKA35636.1 hypothetical protein VC82_2035 [Allomuricauda lutaonensis]